MKILLVDDHTLFREGMRYVLQHLDEQETEILEAGNLRDGMEIAAQHPDLDLALLDLNMPGSEGSASIRLFHRSYPHIPVVVVSGEEGRGHMEKVMSYGALGFIHKNSTAPVMLGALNLVLSGGVYIPPEMVRQQNMLAHEEESGHVDRRRPSIVECSLTPRQREVLAHLAAGLSNREIAEAVCLAEGTIKIHVAGIFQALHVGSRMEAVLMAEKLGLIDKLSHG